MITGELKNKIDGLWETFWTGGLTNPLDVIEQMTYLMFIHDLDDKRSKVNENDIPDIIKRFHNREKEMDRERTEKSFMVPKQEIVDQEYDLSVISRHINNIFKENEIDKESNLHFLQIANSDKPVAYVW